MADKKPEPRPVFAVTERDDKSFWTRVGAAFPNKDGSVNVFLDALPVSGKLQIRDDDERREGDEADERDERRERRTRR
jgi:hypothetical protein